MRHKCRKKTNSTDKKRMNGHTRSHKAGWHAGKKKQRVSDYTTKTTLSQTTEEKLLFSPTLTLNLDLKRKKRIQKMAIKWTTTQWKRLHKWSEEKKWSVKLFFHAMATEIVNALLLLNRPNDIPKFQCTVSTDRNKYNYYHERGDLDTKNCICKHWKWTKKKHAHTHTKRLLTDKHRIVLLLLWFHSNVQHEEPNILNAYSVLCRGKGECCCTFYLGLSL